MEKIIKEMIRGKEITYELREDGMYYPVTYEESVAPLLQMSKYGKARAKYIEETDPKLYREMTSSLKKWWDYLLEIDEEALAMEERLIIEMKKREGVNSELQSKDIMTYIQKLTNIMHSAEEIVMNEIVYS